MSSGSGNIQNAFYAPFRDLVSCGKCFRSCTGLARKTPKQWTCINTTYGVSVQGLLLWENNAEHRLKMELV